MALQQSIRQFRQLLGRFADVFFFLTQRPHDGRRAGSCRRARTGSSRGPSVLQPRDWHAGLLL